MPKRECTPGGETAVSEVMMAKASCDTRSRTSRSMSTRQRAALSHGNVGSHDAPLRGLNSVTTRGNIYGWA